MLCCLPSVLVLLILFVLCVIMGDSEVVNENDITVTEKGKVKKEVKKKVDKWNFSTDESFLDLYERHTCL